MQIVKQQKKNLSQVLEFFYKLYQKAFKQNKTDFLWLMVALNREHLNQ